VSLLLATVFVASLTGSLHCAGMCGPFACFALTGGRGAGTAHRALLHVAYNGGRLLTYAALGTVAGAAGAALDLGGAAFGFQRIALVAAGALMILIGAVTLVQILGLRVPVPAPPGRLGDLLRAAHTRAARLSPTRRALVIGMLSTFLPCGWLYAFAVTAAGTGSPMLGAATMAVFWAGTLPVMVGLGAGVQAAAGRLRRHMPAITAALLVFLGLLAVAGRFSVPALRADQRLAAEIAAGNADAAAEAAPCHDPDAR
jgi:sulfite exporter TauE/SafE